MHPRMSFDGQRGRHTQPPKFAILPDRADDPSAAHRSVPILQIDETAKTASLSFHPNAPTYSFFGGNASVLTNGDVEFCEAAGAVTSGVIYEVTNANAPVWQMQVSNFIYRGQRLPSLYPGVQW